MRKMKKIMAGWLKLKGLSAQFLVMESGGKHPKMRNTQSGDWIPVPLTPSDHRSLCNFRASLLRLVSTGRGFIFEQTGRLPM